MSFKTRLTVEVVGVHEWRLVAELVYWSRQTQEEFRVPVGFHTDLASIPRIPIVYEIFEGEAKEAAVLHDYLYATGAVPRIEADGVFLEAMEDCGVSRWKRWAMYAAVRIGGASFYKGKD